MKGLPRSLSRGPRESRPIVTQRIRLSGVSITVDGATGVGFGSVPIYPLPEGNVVLLSAIAYAKFTKTTAGITDTFTGNFGVGTTPADDGTISGADVLAVDSTAIGAATAGVSARIRGVQASPATKIIDNTAGNIDIYLNLLIADAAINADDQNVLADIELDLAYIVMNDD